MIEIYRNLVRSLGDFEIISRYRYITTLEVVELYSLQFEFE